MTVRQRNLAAVAAGLVAACVGLAPRGLVASPITLWDLNSSAVVDPASDSGMVAWTVDGVSHLYQQWFWYRIGPSGPEKPINQLGVLAHKLTDADFDPNAETLSLRYTGQAARVDIVFTLNGSTPGNHRSDIAESITITNLTAAAMEFHFFQYCDLNLNGTPDDALVQITNGNTAIQRDQSVWASETVITPRPTYLQVALAGVILASLSDGNATTLNNQAGPVGPGDLTWAFQWDFLIPGGQSVLISKDKAIVPEPATIALLGLGSLLALRRRAGR